MFAVFLNFVACHMLYLALHLEGGSFPKPLTPKQEIEAFEAFKAGDMQARDRLIQHNLRLVAHVVKKYYTMPGDGDDLISIGTIGLIKAVNSFDNTKKARFSTYASRCIDNEVRMSFRKLKKAPPTVSMQEPIEAAKDGSTLTVIDVVPDDFLIEEDCENRDEATRLRCMVERLPARQRQVIMLRYGLSGQEPLTQQQVADMLGISRSYISRIEKAAVEWLRGQLLSQNSVK